ncbi:MAG: type II secretion system minor pseudopilin GspK [Janthinobacterium lividum]
MKRPGDVRIAQRGVALLAAMLTVTLVATFAAAALWQQWRAVEVETAERARMQASWVLIGAIDWSRLILREDGHSGGTNNGIDSLSEPWAVPLEEARLTSFLAADKNVASDALDGLPDAFLSGRIIDAQSKMNVLNLVDAGKPAAGPLAAFTKLFTMLGLPPQELSTMVDSLVRAVPAPAAIVNTMTTSAATGSTSATSTNTTSTSTSATAPSADAPLLPQQVSQLVWLGLSSSTVTALEPYITILPVRTPININTAGPEVLYATMPKLDMAGAQRVVALRARGAFTQLGKMTDAVANAQLVDGQQSVATDFFEIYGKLRLDRTWVEEHSLVRRIENDVTILWRERGAGTTLVPSKP